MNGEKIHLDEKDWRKNRFERRKAKVCSETHFKYFNGVVNKQLNK